MVKPDFDLYTGGGSVPENRHEMPVEVAGSLSAYVRIPTKIS